MPITALYEGSASISTTEWSLTTGTSGPDADTTDGVFQIFLDLSALAAGDEYQLKLYEKVQSAGTQRSFHTEYFVGAQSDPHWVSGALVLMHGWDVTLDKIAGTDRTIAWSIRQIS